MAIENNSARSLFETTFGRRAVPTSQDYEERAPAQFWLNIGYRTDSELYPFVSLAQGIPLDTITPLTVGGRNEAFRAFQSARNDLHTQIMSLAEALKPGEDRIWECENGLAIQIRRVEEPQQTIEPENNEFARKLFLD